MLVTILSYLHFVPSKWEKNPDLKVLNSKHLLVSQVGDVNNIIYWKNIKELRGTCKFFRIFWRIVKA